MYSYTFVLTKDMPIEKERVLSIHNPQEYEIRIGRKKAVGEWYW